MIKTKMLAVCLIITTLLILFACSNTANTFNVKDKIDYSKNNYFEAEVIDSDHALAYIPKDSDYRYGLIFYVGTILPPSSYQNIAQKLASEGYLIVIPKIKSNMAYNNYNQNERAFEDYPDVDFFVGGHSQGGGAAIRRAYEESERVLGAVLYSPLAYSNDSIKNTDIPVLLIEASNDKVLTEKMKEDARSRLPENTQRTVIEGGNHMGYCEILFPFDGAMEITKAEMQSIVAERTIDFMRAIITEDDNE